MSNRSRLKDWLFNALLTLPPLAFLTLAILEVFFDAFSFGNFFVSLVSTTMVLAGGSLLLSGLLVTFKIISPRKPLQTMGLVHKVDVIETTDSDGDKTYWVSVKYTYHIQGQEYRKRQSRGYFQKRDKAEEVAAAYKDQSIIVYYDSQKPSLSRLDRNPGSALPYILHGLILSLMAYFIGRLATYSVWPDRIWLDPQNVEAEILIGTSLPLFASGIVAGLIWLKGTHSLNMNLVNQEADQEAYYQGNPALLFLHESWTYRNINGFFAALYLGLAVYLFTLLF